ncbi:MAG TPA: hypothetical protein VHG28_01040 [Longimicrobiaceae bacterium]|nr:hypothetical protein [Longimicrobiaceae bacterium]
MSFFLSALTYLIAVRYQRDPTISLVIALQPAMLGLLVEVLYEVLKAKRELMQSLDLFVTVNRSGRLRPFIERILSVCRDENIQAIPILPLRERVIGNLDWLTRNVEDLAYGHIRFDSANWFAVDTELVTSATTEILATSHADASSVWESTLGRNYWAINKDRIRKGVKCTRIFILSKSELQDRAKLEKILRIMEEQQACGVAVHVVEEHQISRDLWKDFAIIDGLVCSSTILTHDGEGAGVDICWRQSELSKVRGEFNLILRNAMPLDEYRQASLADTGSRAG